MKRINLTKYGFVRWPEEDFSDDGNRFQCYRAGKSVRVSKLISNGQIYLSIDACCGNNTLPYEIYSKLDYYNEASWTYNGVSVEDLTEEDIQTFYEACISYEAAYLEEEAHVVYPTIEELTARCEELRAKAICEHAAGQKVLIDAVLGNKFTKLSEYEVREVKSYLTHLEAATKGYDPKTYPQSIYKRAYSFSIMAPNFHDLKESYWLKALKDIFVNK